MLLEIGPFEGEHVEAAGRLLAARHRRHRTASPLLDPRYADPVACAEQVAAAWGGEHAAGAVATRGGTVVGYLLGASTGSPVWGPGQWVESAGQALADDEDPELVRDLYAAAAARWHEQGRTAHYVLVPAHDEPLLRAWFGLGFGHQHTHAVRRTLDRAPTPPPGVTIRPAVREDLPALAAGDVELHRHQRRSPVFSSAEPPSLDQARQEWEQDWGDPELTTWVAVRHGEVVGHAVGCPLTRSGAHRGPARPANAGFLGFAVVLPQARGLGVGRALGETVAHWSGAAGYDCVATDWRQTNLLSSRAWPALGFEPTFLRLHRLLGY